MGFIVAWVEPVVVEDSWGTFVVPVPMVSTALDVVRSDVESGEGVVTSVLDVEVEEAVFWFHLVRLLTFILLIYTGYEKSCMPFNSNHIHDSKQIEM